MNPERDSSGDKPLDLDLNSMVDELCDYMSRLDNADVDELDPLGLTATPGALQSTMMECRSLLDFLHEARSHTGFPLQESLPAEGFAGFTLPPQIGRFKIVASLGFGGYGVVFRGVDPDNGREVAIKIPRPEFLESPELIHRFAREASIVAQLSHPNIVSIYESECYGIVPYIVMDFIPGKTLSEWRAAESEVAPQTVARIVLDLARGVAHAHERGVLHRDVKPGNVILAPRDSAASASEFAFVPVLTDFGVAQCADFTSRRTQSGAMIGTMRYMSPEQAAGRTHEITRRTDVYGLGTILYELLTGHPPFQATNHQQLLHNVLHDAPVAPRKIRSTTPISLELICSRCMEKVQANRYSSADELADDLQRFLSGEPIRARPASLLAKTRQLIRRYPGRASIFALTVAGTIATIVIALQVNARLADLLTTAESERATARQNELVAKRRAYCSDMRNAKRSFDRGNLRLMFKLLDRYSVVDPENDYRDFAWSYLWGKYLNTSQVLGHHEGGATSVAVTRKGDLAASGGEDSVIRLWSIPSRELVRELRGHEYGAVEAVSFSPDGRHLVSGGADGTVRAWDMETFKEQFVRHDHNSAIFDVIYSSQGHFVASAGGDRQIRLWNPETGEPVGVLSGHADKVLCLASHPTKDLLASGGADSTIRLWEVNSLRPDSTIKDGAIPVPGGVWPRALVFEPNGKSLAAGILKAETLRFSMQKENYGEMIERLFEPANALHMAWPQDGPLIVGLGNSQIRYSDQREPTLRGHSGAVVSIGSPSDGTYLISAALDGDVRYWPQFQQQSKIVIETDQDAVTKVNPRNFTAQWHRDILAADLKQQKVSIYRMPEKKLERNFPKEDADYFVLSPSGNLLLICQPNGIATCFHVADGRILWSRQLSPNSVDNRLDWCAIDGSESYALIASFKELIVISMQNAEVLHRLVHPDNVRSVLFLEKAGERLTAVSTCGDGIMRFWDIQEGKQRREIDYGSTASYALAISPDSQFLAMTQGGINALVRVWNLETWKEVTSISISTTNRSSGFEVNSIGFLSSQKLFVQANSDFFLWDIAEETEVCTFPEYDQSGAFALNLDAQQLAVPVQGQIQLIDGRRP